MSRPSAAFALVALLVLAGCAAPLVPGGAGDDSAGPESGTGSATPPVGATSTAPPETTTSTPSPTTTRSDPPASIPGTPVVDEQVPVNGTLGPNASVVLARVEFLTGRDVPAPTVTVNRTHDTAIYGNFSDYDFYRLWGVTETRRTAEPAAYATREGNVTVLPRNASAAVVERLLSHEFAHVVQYHSEVDRGPAVPTIDRSLATRSLVEGSAVYVSAQYTKRYHPERPTQARRFARVYERGPVANRYTVAPYHFGYRYVAATVDSPRELDVLYRDPPTTTEQVLHPGVTEGPAPLNATANDTGGEWTRISDHRRGELVLRVVLRGELDGETAAEVAAGWGNDRSLHFANWSGGRAMAWVVRLDSTADADEFAAAARTFAERRTRAAPPPLVTDARRVGPETVVLLTGPERFVRGTTVRGQAPNVTLTVP